MNNNGGAKIVNALGGRDSCDRHGVIVMGDGHHVSGEDIRTQVVL
jgi:hypothetical protein